MGQLCNSSVHTCLAALRPCGMAIAPHRWPRLSSLQGIAAAYSVRVTFISGDVHVGAFGCFQAHPKQPIRVVDPKYMLQVITLRQGEERCKVASAGREGREALFGACQAHTNLDP